MKRYFVKLPRYVIEPEEILIDALRHSDPLTERMELAIQKGSLRIFLYLGVIGLTILFGYSAYLTIIQHKKYLGQAEANRLRLVFEEAPRGKIYDRFGTILADNKEVFDIAVLPLMIPKEDEILSNLSKKLANIVGVPKDEVEEKLRIFRNRVYAQPLPIWTKVNPQIAAMIEKEKDNLPGIKVIGRYIRVYPGGPAFSHLLGYTGRITKEELKNIPNASLNDLVRRSL